MIIDCHPNFNILQVTVKCDVTGFPKPEVGIWMLTGDPWEDFIRESQQFSWAGSPSLEIDRQWSSDDGMFCREAWLTLIFTITVRQNIYKDHGH